MHACLTGQRALPASAPFAHLTAVLVCPLRAGCRGAQFVTSKSSEMNVTFPVSEAEDAEWVSDGS